MRSIPVKEAAFSGFVCVAAPEAKLVDPDTGEVKKDRRSGQPVWTVGVCAMRGRDSSVIQVAVVGEPTGLGVGIPVRVVDLEAVPWDREGRSGVAWRAERVLPAGPGLMPAPTTTASGPAAAGPGTAGPVMGGRPASGKEGQ